MKHLLVLIVFLFLSLTFDIHASYYWTSPTNGSSHYSLSSGRAEVYYFLENTDAIRVGNEQYRYRKDGGSWTDWIDFYSSYLYFTAAGTYELQARLWIYYDVWGQSNYWDLSTIVTIHIYDNNAPGTPLNLSVSENSNGHPLLAWDANNEYDLNRYEIWKKGGDQGGSDWAYYGSTTATSFEDDEETVVTGSYIQNETKVYYKIKAVDVNENKSLFSSEVDIRVRIPAPSKSFPFFTQEDKVEEYYLAQNYPNPFNPSTAIYYQVKQKGHVQLFIYDITGKKVATLVNKLQESGGYNVRFNANHLPSGVYIYSLRINNFYQVNKMTLMK
jgi:hypothetical protein